MLPNCFVAKLFCCQVGLSPNWFVAKLVCRQIGLSPNKLPTEISSSEELQEEEFEKVWTGQLVSSFRWNSYSVKTRESLWCLNFISRDTLPIDTSSLFCRNWTVPRLHSAVGKRRSVGGWILKSCYSCVIGKMSKGKVAWKVKAWAPNFCTHSICTQWMGELKQSFFEWRQTKHFRRDSCFLHPMFHKK